MLIEIKIYLSKQYHLEYKNISSKNIAECLMESDEDFLAIYED